MNPFGNCRRWSQRTRAWHNRGGAIPPTLRQNCEPAREPSRMRAPNDRQDGSARYANRAPLVSNAPGRGTDRGVRVLRRIRICSSLLRRASQLHAFASGPGIGVSAHSQSHGRIDQRRRGSGRALWGQRCVLQPGANLRRQSPEVFAKDPLRASAISGSGGKARENQRSGRRARALERS